MTRNAPSLAALIRAATARAVPSPFAAFVASTIGIGVSLALTLAVPAALRATGATPFGVTPLTAFAIGGVLCWLAVLAHILAYAYAVFASPDA